MPSWALPSPGSWPWHVQLPHFSAGPGREGTGAGVRGVGAWLVAQLWLAANLLCWVLTCWAHLAGTSLRACSARVGSTITL